MGSADSRPRPSIRYRFGPFELDPAAAELRRRGIRVRLVGQPLQILRILVQNSERIVTREELREALWPGDVHVDFDGALNTAIKKLRQTLEDNAAEERYIQTVPRVGHRFVAPVEVVMPAPPQPVAVLPGLVVVPPAELPPEPAPPAPPVPVRRRAWLWAAAVACAALAGVAGAEIWRWTRPSPAVLANRVYLTSFPGEQTVPSISPDGGQVAFSWIDPDRDKLPSIYITSINGQGLHRLTNNSSDFAPAWSPDGSQIAFIRDMPNGRGAVLVTSSSGGAERRLGETDGRFLAWAPGGGAVLSATQIPRERNFELWSISVATGERRLVTAAGEPVDGWERFAYSPDGSQLAYAAWTGTQSPAELFVRPASTSDGRARQVTHLGSNFRGWCWLPDSRSVLVVSDEQGTRRLFRIRLDDPRAALEPLEGAGDDVLHPAAVAVAGQVRLVFCQQRHTSNIYRFGVRRDARGIPVALDAPHSVAPSTRASSNPQVSPDGRRLTFVSNRSQFGEIWLSDGDGANARPLTSFASSHLNPGSPRWSPDGSKIAFTVSENGVSDLYLTAADGGPLARLTHHTFDAGRPSFSHDGQWIYFSKRDTPMDKLRLWKIPARAGAAESDLAPLLGLEGWEPIESAEGGLLYYLPSASSHELWSVPLAGGAPRKVIGSGIVSGWWIPVTGGVYYVDLSGIGTPDAPEHPPVLYFDSASGTSRVIGRLPGPVAPQQPGLSAEGDSLWSDWIEVSTINLIRGELR